MASTASLEIWFVTGSQHLYGPETLATVAENSTKIAASLEQLVNKLGCKNNPVP